MASTIIESNDFVELIMVFTNCCTYYLVDTKSGNNRAWRLCVEINDYMKGHPFI